MAVLCQDLNLLYIQVPGTGCSVVGKLLRDRFGGENLGRKHNDIPELLREGLLTEEELSRFLVVANVRNPFDRMVTYYQRLHGPWQEEQLAWARRHLERQKTKGEITGDEYQRRLAGWPKIEARKRRRMRRIERVGFNPWLVVTLLRWRLRDRRAGRDAHGLRFAHHVFPMLEHVDVALKQEQLEVALNAALRPLGVAEQVDLPRKNITKGKKPYTAYYNDISRRVMEQIYHDELAFMGYGFEGDEGEEALVWLSTERAVL